MARALVEVRGPFSLARACAFIEGFVPTRGAVDASDGAVRVAFVPDGASRAASAVLRMEDGAVIAEASAPDGDDDAALRQAVRMLSLDVDATGYAELGDREPAVGALQARHEGFRPVSFPSPFEAGAWFLLSHRVRMAQAAAVRRRISEAHGDAVTVDGVALRAFPPPERIARLDAVDGLSERKLENLRALAGAALEGRLDGERLRAMDPDVALAELRELPGVGPFTAQGIVVRGANAPDVAAFDVPRLGEEVARVYGLEAAPERDEIEALSDGWRPFRSWVQVLLHIGIREVVRGDTA